jgi:type II secretion system protein I
MRLHNGNKKSAVRAPQTNRTGEQGFTLIETAVALVVMMIAGLAVSSLFLYATNYNSGAYDRSLALTVAQQRMERLRQSSFSEVVSSTETVTSAGRSFNVVTTVSGTTLKTISVSVSPQAAGAGWVQSPVVVVSQRANTGTGSYYQ